MNKRDAIKALHRARYAVLLSMIVLHAVFLYLHVSDELIKKIKSDCLKDAGEVMKKVYGIKMPRL